MSKTQAAIADACDQVKNLLLEKNLKYGNSALFPCRVFSKASAVEQLLVRIDDKLSRIQKGAGLLATDEDVIQDLIGYLVLLKIAMKDESSPPDPTELYDEIINFTKWNEKPPEDQWDGVDIEPNVLKLRFN
jgi:hypothetical protein